MPMAIAMLDAIRVFLTVGFITFLQLKLIKTTLYLTNNTYSCFYVKTRSVLPADPEKNYSQPLRAVSIPPMTNCNPCAT
jgi:hypothetical protein